MSKIENISDADFDAKVLNSDKPVIVDFWAEWCGPCKAIAPHLESLSAKTPEVAVVKVDVDKNTEKAPAFGIRGIPTIILFHKGEEVSRVVGMNIPELEKMFVQGQSL